MNGIMRGGGPGLARRPGFVLAKQTTRPRSHSGSGPWATEGPGDGDLFATRPAEAGKQRDLPNETSLPASVLVPSVSDPPAGSWPISRGSGPRPPEAHAPMKKAIQSRNFK